MFSLLRITGCVSGFVDSSNTSALVTHELCTLYLSPLYRPEEGIENLTLKTKVLLFENNIQMTTIRF